MSIYKKENKFVWLLILLASFFVLIFFTQNMFYSMQEKLDLESELSIKNDGKTAELSKLESLEKDLASWEKQSEISRFTESFSEDEIISYLHNYVENINTQDSMIIIRDLSIEKPVDWELGFKEINVNLNIKVTNEEILKVFLDFLTSPDSKYSFFITDFSFSNDKKFGSFNVNIPLKLLYK